VRRRVFRQAVRDSGRARKGYATKPRIFSRLSAKKPKKLVYRSRYIGYGYLNPNESSLVVQTIQRRWVDAVRDPHQLIPDILRRTSNGRFIIQKEESSIGLWIVGHAFCPAVWFRRIIRKLRMKGSHSFLDGKVHKSPDYLEAMNPVSLLIHVQNDFTSCLLTCLAITFKFHQNVEVILDSNLLLHNLRVLYKEPRVNRITVTILPVTRFTLTSATLPIKRNTEPLPASCLGTCVRSSAISLLAKAILRGSSGPMSTEYCLALHLMLPRQE